MDLYGLWWQRGHMTEIWAEQHLYETSLQDAAMAHQLRFARRKLRSEVFEQLADRANPRVRVMIQHRCTCAVPNG